MSNSVRWYALYVRSQHEKCVAAQLEAKHYKVFLPVYMMRRKWADRWKTLQLPLFPGYVFCSFDSSNRSPVLTTSGVIDIVRLGGHPTPVEDSVIESLQIIASSSLRAEPYEGLLRGERILILDGPLRGLSGTLIEIRTRLRLVVSVELLQRSVLVEVEREWVLPCEPKRSPLIGSPVMPVSSKAASLTEPYERECSS